ncbi:hypothetical protein NHP164001_01940 [Helicobacter trogontum]|uniref:Protein hydE n=1 Tax=Helicobacter trogontum TaxID=50960 RepID=A0ABQ0D1G3_9HELI
MQPQKSQEVHDEILFIGNPSQQIHIHKHKENKNALEDTQILECVFTFVRKNTLHSKALQSILVRLLYELEQLLNIKEIFYKDNGLDSFCVYVQADSTNILALADNLSHKLSLGLDFTFKDIKQLGIDEFNHAKTKECVFIHTSNKGLDSDTTKSHIKDHVSSYPNFTNSLVSDSKMPNSTSITTQIIHTNHSQIKPLESKQGPSLLLPNVDEMHILLKGDIEHSVDMIGNDTLRVVSQAHEVSHLDSNLPKQTDECEIHGDKKLDPAQSTLKSLESTQILGSLDSTNKTVSITRFIKLQSLNVKPYDADKLAVLNEEQMGHFIKYELIEALAQILMNDTTITLKRNAITFTLSLRNIMPNEIQDEAPFILFGTLDSAQSYLRMSEAQKSMLASFEKPFVSTQCKEVFAKEFGADTILAGLSSDIIVLLLLSYLQSKHEISYLFYMPHSDSMQDLKVMQSHDTLLSYIDAYPYTYIDKNKILESTYSVAEHIYLSHLQTHKSLYALLRSNAAKSARFITFLSTTHRSEFLIEKPQNTESNLQQILDISFSTDLYKHLEILHSYKNGDKLIFNFTKANADIVTKWNLTQNELEKLGIHELIKPSAVTRKQHIKTNNLLDILELIEQILNIESSALIYANRCVRDRGPRIDYKLIRQGDSIVLDYARLLRSVMSFQLAGVENELICYGVIDSLAEFIGTLAGDMMLNYGIQEVFVCGDLLLKQCFLDKIIKAIPKNMNVAFAGVGGTDYLD